MVSINFEYNPDFLKEEVRDGHLVTEETKKLWLVELDILNKVIQVCDKYGLTYWAEGGTLLGAVRHGGYVPWDDDIDIMMPRKDYEKLLSLADIEFPYPYLVEPKYKCSSMWFTKIKRADTTKIRMYNKDVPRTDWKFHTSWPGCISIDIFCADNCPDDEEERRHFYEDEILPASRAYIMANHKYGREFFNGKLSDEEMNKLMEDSIEKYKVFDDTCQKYDDKETKYQFNNGFPRYPMWRGQMKYKEDYKDTVYLPFEMLSLRCPKGYERVLDMHYTERTGIPWQTPTKNLAYHSQEVRYFLDFDRPYTDYSILIYDHPEFYRKDCQ